MLKIRITVLFALITSISIAQSLEVIEILGSPPCNIQDFFGRYTKHSGSLSPIVESKLQSNGSFCDCYNHKSSSSILFIGSDATMDFVVVYALPGTIGNGCGTANGNGGAGGIMTRTPKTQNCSLEGFELEMAINCQVEVIPTYGNNIPTLSQWGLIILGFFLSIFGIIAVRQRSIGLA